MVRKQFKKPKTRSTIGSKKAHGFGDVTSYETLQDMAASDLCPKCRSENRKPLGEGRFYCNNCGHTWLLILPNLKAMIKNKLRYLYRIFDMGPGSGNRFGACEVCGRPTNRVYHQIREREYLRPDGSIGLTSIGDLFGHKSCLIARRKKYKV